MGRGMSPPSLSWILYCRQTPVYSRMHFNTWAQVVTEDGKGQEATILLDICFKAEVLCFRMYLDFRDIVL